MYIYLCENNYIWLNYNFNYYIYWKYFYENFKSNKFFNPILHLSINQAVLNIK